MTQENISYFLQLPEDFPLTDLRKIAQNLSDEDVFLPAYIAPEIGLYEVEGYFYGADIEKLSYRIFPDRNLISRIVSIARGNPTNQHSKLAANVMAFAQCLDIQFEPSISFHEYATSAGNESAMDELKYFRLADKPAPSIWIDLALGRKDIHIFDGELTALPALDLSMPLTRWKRNYVACLKVAELELNGDKPITKMLKLLEWMFNDFILAGPAMCFAALYFSDQFPRGGMLKSLRSQNRQTAQLGVENAAWDITYLSDCVLKANAASNLNMRFIFATNDKALRRVGELIFTSTEKGIFEDETASLLSQWWGRKDANIITKQINLLYKNQSSPHRKFSQNQSSDFVTSMIKHGESALISPKR
jgi:hypothetical protein